jgi:transcriptional regulator with XRE-family HTH domain
MDRDEQAEARWPIDLEATVAKNLRRLRESHGLSQEQLGSDLALHGFGMHYTTVAQVEVGARPLRLNEVAALAALFQVPIESLWQQHAETPDEHQAEHQAEHPDEREAEVQDSRAAARAAGAEQMTADYYSRQRQERLRDK